MAVVASGVLFFTAKPAATQEQPPRLLGADELAHLGRAEPGERIRYGDDPLQFGELHLPEGAGPFPAVVYFHGGCWRSDFGGLENSRAIAGAIAKLGVAVWNVEYRRVGDPGGGWPGTFEDAAAGADHLTELASRHPIDLERVITMGHSVGGHLALWTAARRKMAPGVGLRGTDPIRLQGVVGLAPVPEVIMMHADGVCEGSAARLMGGSPEALPERYRIATPSRFSPLGVPQHLLLGRFDQRWAPNGRAYVEAARAAGDDRITLVEAPESGHFELMDPSTSTWPLVRDAVLSLLRIEESEVIEKLNAASEIRDPAAREAERDTCEPAARAAPLVRGQERRPLRDSFARDANGQPRLTLNVQADGQASISFLDEDGEVVRTIAGPG